MMRIGQTIFAACTALLISCLFAMAIFSTTIARMDLRELAQSAQIVVYARCEGSQPRWESGSIWSDYEFTAIEALKGAPPHLFRVRLPGGRIGHLETKVDGVPRFRTGEEVVLFVEPISGGGYSITSWAQGTFRVHRNAVGEARLTQDTSHFAVFDPATRNFMSAGIRDISLSDFRKQVAEALRVNASRR
ncbi:MAG: hypothetical protein WAM91_09730 [Candidatus Acidiferrales bacterium]